MTWRRQLWAALIGVSSLALACGQSQTETTHQDVGRAQPIAQNVLEVSGGEDVLEASGGEDVSHASGGEDVSHASGAVEVVRLAPQDQDALDAHMRRAIDSHLIPGGVLLLGRADGVIFQRAYGSRDAGPPAEPMTLDTIFDLASLTKPIVTATAVMQLVERGDLALDAPIADYLPTFAAERKTATLRQALLHTSGLPAVDPLSAYLGDRDADLARILRLAPAADAGARYVYSDLGYIVLGALIERVSRQRLGAYADAQIFAPLGMRESAMGGVPGEDARVAPTEERDDAPIRNAVDDPRAYRLGGYAGNAGLFSSAADLARFARMLLNHGELDGTRVLSAASVAEMTRAIDLPGHHRRGLGWDMQPPHSSGLSDAAYGHGGYTGTWIFIDPARDLFIVLLTNVVHGGRAGTLGELRRDVARIALDALPRVADIRSQPATPVLAGVDVLRRRGMRLFDDAGASPPRAPRVGLLTHGAARTRDGLKTVDLLIDRPEIDVVRVFTPEHGLDAQHEGRVRGGSYRGVPLTSLFGRRRAPRVADLRGLDALVVDLVDVGTRFYTYPSTLLAALRVAAEADVAVVVLDRPNPLGGVLVQGPVSRPSEPSFVNSFPLPIRHGLTLGELARLFVSELSLSVRLEVVAPAGWSRSARFADTGLAWSPPSPNLPTPESALLYPATALIEGANVSVGRGTDSPFALVGAPYLDADALAVRLSAAQLPGVRFEPAHFTPRARPYRNRACHGVRLVLSDADAFRAARTGFALLLALRAEAPRRFDLDATAGLVADDALLEMLRGGAPLEALERAWQPDLERFEAQRAQILDEARSMSVR
ncbi:MAG: DUF1343 domain-containing protein [Deltaproteobacteria bacterium]|nr:DUF1343 domain-containing protein [Deltaproteobacteria bacterium]